MVFTYPWFLLCLFATAIPVVIHLFELRRPQRVFFTNVEFIREVKLIAAKQRKLKHLLVLLARVGFIIFLVLLFAQPFIPAKDQGDNNGGAVSILLDQSASMQQAAKSGESAFEVALKEAEELPLAFPPTSRFALLGQRETSTAAAYRATIQQLQPSGQFRGIAQMLRLAQTGLGSNRGAVFVFSDFQKNDAINQAIESIDTAKQVYLVPVAGEAGSNVFVDSVWLDDAFIRTNVDALLRIRLRNGGDKQVNNCPVKLFVGNKQVGAFQAAIPAKQSIVTAVRVRLVGTETQACRVEVEDVPVEFDNIYYFMLQPSTRIKVLEIATNSSLDKLYGNEPLFSYQHVRPQLTDYRAIADANLIVLREAESLSSGLQQSLRQAAQRGATVVVVPSASKQAQVAYNTLFRELGIGRIQWEANAAGVTPALRDIAEPSKQNSFFRDVFAAKNRPASMPKAAPVLRWARSGTDVLQLRDGDGFLAAFPSGKGSVYLFSSPFNQAYSDFTQHALFVPVMYRLAMQSHQQVQPLAYQLSEQTFRVNLPEQLPATANRETVYRLRHDSATYIPAQRVQDGRLVMDVPPGMQEPGYYELLRGEKLISKLAFNFDKRESDLSSYSAAELRQLVGDNHPNVRVYEPGAGQTVAAQYKATRVGVPLWRYCLVGALVCLLAEAFLLRFAGRKHTAVPVAQAA